MKRCDYCGKVAEYDGQPHGIEDCAEHLRLENVSLRQQLENVEGLIPYWDRQAKAAQARLNGRVIAVMYRGAIADVRMALQTAMDNNTQEAK